MRTQFLTILAGVLMATACHTVSPVGSGGHSGSGLTSVKFENLPKQEELRTYFGANANVQLLDSISIVVQPIDASCKGATSVAQIADYNKGGIDASVFPGCDYNVVVAIGQKVVGSVQPAAIQGSNATDASVNALIAKNQGILGSLNKLINPIYVNFSVVNLSASDLKNAPDHKFRFDVVLKLTKFGLDAKFPERVNLGQSSSPSDLGENVTIIKDVFTGYSTSAYSMTDNGESVVKDFDSYRSLNDQITAGEIRDTNIDFNNVMLIGAIRKVDSSNYDIKIKEVKKYSSDKTIRAKIVFYTPGQNCPSSAASAAVVHYVAIDKSDYTVKFDVTEEIKNCN